VTAAEIPALLDEVPALAVLAARAHGETRVEGADELRVKESDRLLALAENLRSVGVEAADDAGTLTVVGGEGPLNGHVTSHGDHRIAMAFGVLGALEDGIALDDPAIVAISYPRFWDDLAAMRTELSR
jgi:3-phosphoshikimate 1-carboxyvinyltransferase